MRSIPEWKGKTDDTPVPPRVRLRVFNRFGGVCYLSGKAIRPGDKWEIEHVIALSNGGEHRESNMAPALVVPHRAKTKQDRKLKAKVDRVRKRHLGIRKPRTITAWRNFKGEIVRKTRQR
jgi:5-methylcytosine-specific restriction endonuclease McrA